jgi:tetratricopeptide (TPR) repeat protein
MNRTRVVRVIVAGVLSAVLAFIAIPASAQTQIGTLRGKVVDADGKPVADAQLTFDYVGPYQIHLTAKTNAKGEWTRGGLNADSSGRWNIVVTKGDLGALAQGRPGIGETTDVPDIVIKPGGARVGGPAPEKETKEQADARAKASAIDKYFADANNAMTANNFDAAITAMDAATTALPTCAKCYAKLGDVYMKKPDSAKDAEKAYLKAVELDPKMAAVYDLLASMYNQQKRFDEAGKMSAKASELHSAGGGGGDATSAYNAGIIFWNQGKAPEARAQFEQALKLDPKMAEAQYYIGLALLNEGKMADAKKAFQTYLTLAPNGPNAATAKGMVAELK